MAAARCVRACLAVGAAWVATFGAAAAAWYVLPSLPCMVDAAAAQERAEQDRLDGLQAWYEEAAMAERLNYIHNTLTSGEEMEVGR